MEILQPEISLRIVLSRLLGGAPWESKACAEYKTKGIKCLFSSISTVPVTQLSYSF